MEYVLPRGFLKLLGQHGQHMLMLLLPVCMLNGDQKLKILGQVVVVIGGEGQGVNPMC